MSDSSARAQIFGEVADEYDRIRPDYPTALIDDVLAYADLAEPAAALEVGAGTGKATVAFIARGIAVTAIEPDARMAALLERRVGTAAEIIVSAFEDHVPITRFGLLYSAQAWHWTNHTTRWRDAIRALTPGGAIALFWNADRPEDPAVVDAILAAHEAHAPDTRPGLMPADFGTDEYTELVEAPGFTDRVHRWYASQRRLSPDDYLAYLATTSGYRILDEATRERLFGVIRTSLGDEVVLTVRTALALARAKH